MEVLKVGASSSCCTGRHFPGIPSKASFPKHERAQEGWWKPARIERGQSLEATTSLTMMPSFAAPAQRTIAQPSSARSRAVVRAASVDDSFESPEEVRDGLRDAESAVARGFERAGESVERGLLPEYAAWDRVTERLVLLSSVVSLFMQVPQILKNAASLQEGQTAALAILPWIGYSTGYLGNMLLLSYFVGKRENSAIFVQAVGATSTVIVLWQIYLAGFMPSTALAVVTGALVVAFAVNALRYSRALPERAWSTWQDLTGVLGLAALPQVIWSTFSDAATVLPGALSAAGGVLLVAALRAGRLPEGVRAAWAKASGWTATLLFMFMPIPQLQACFTRPESLAGISILAPILAMTANGLMVPRALFTRDTVWFTGASWGAVMMGWGVLLSMVINAAISPTLFFLCTTIFIAYVITVLLKDSRAHRLSSPFASLRKLFSSL